MYSIYDLRKEFRLNVHVDRFNKELDMWLPVEYQVNDAGYAMVDVSGELIAYHRLVWMLYHKIPVPAGYVIDHIDGNRLNNTIENLRLATYRTNAQNLDVHRKGRKAGVKKNKRGTYSACISINNEQISLGTYPSEEEAEAIYLYACDYTGEYIDRGQFIKFLNEKAGFYNRYNPKQPTYDRSQHTPTKTVSEAKSYNAITPIAVHTELTYDTSINKFRIRSQIGPRKVFVCLYIFKDSAELAKDVIPLLASQYKSNMQFQHMLEEYCMDVYNKKLI